MVYEFQVVIVCDSCKKEEIWHFKDNMLDIKIEEFPVEELMQKRKWKIEKDKDGKVNHICAKCHWSDDDNKKLKDLMDGELPA